MAQYIIQGGNKLSGKSWISGNKNSILPCLAAALLTKERVVLKNCPRILDVEVMMELLKSLGAKVETEGDTISIECRRISQKKLPQSLVTKLRASILLVGALIGRVGEVEFFHPGGDVIGRRAFDLHLDGFRKLGFKVVIKDHFYKVVRGERVSAECADIFLEIPTVTGTENLILASVLGSKKVTIKNAAQEPHVVDLCKMLLSMGAKIQGMGTQTLVIEGVKKLEGAEFAISSDAIEFGTYAVAAAITGGEIELNFKQKMDLDPIVWPMVKMGVSFSPTEEGCKISAKKLTAVQKVITNVWPGFPTDLMSALIVLSTQAQGVSLLHDWLYESRMFFVDKLISMGANITIADPHRVLVYGPTPLLGRTLESPDIRAGMALVLAALAAKGQSTINRAELIERGYEDVVGKLTELGADIKRVV